MNIITNSIKNKYTVKPLEREQCREWLLFKHYAKSIPSIVQSFGLYDSASLQGVCCYGSPANNHNNTMGGFRQLELVRLVVNDSLPKNTLSFFVSQTFKYFDGPLSLISYADQGKNHHGYIYQATNWVYTGLGGGVDFYLNIDGKEIHSRIMSDHRIKHPDKTREQICEMLNWTKQKGTFKYRYFYFIGNKKDKKIWLSSVKEKYDILSYPKGDNIRYDSSYRPVTQKLLF